MANAYLKGMRTKNQSSPTKTLLLWITFAFMFALVWHFLRPSEREDVRQMSPRSASAATDPDAPLRAEGAASFRPYAWFVGGGVTLFALIVVVGLRNQARQNTLLREADTKLQQEDITAAMQAAHLVLKDAENLQRFGALMVLGQCAERRGDFEDAAEIYGKAASAMPALLGVGHSEKIVGPVANARRAFALAAADRLDEAETLLSVPLLAQAVPGTSALRVCARTVVDSKRGRYKELLDRLALSRAAVRESLALRDRLLLRAIAVHARISIADAHRGASAPQIFVGPELADWITRIVPRVRPFLGGAS